MYLFLIKNLQDRKPLNLFHFRGNTRNSFTRMLSTEARLVDIFGESAQLTTILDASSS